MLTYQIIQKSLLVTGKDRGKIMMTDEELERLLREMHSSIAVLNSEMKNVKTMQGETSDKLDNIKELVLKQNGRVNRNTEELNQHIEYHRRMDRTNLMKVGMLVSVLTTAISIIFKWVFNK